MSNTKIELPAKTVLTPLPVVLVSCRDASGRANVMTAAWTGVVCSDPVLVSVSIRPSRLTHAMIIESQEFVLNVPSATLARAVDVCGVVSGRSGDKFAASGLTPVAASKVRAPLVAECPLSLECRVTQRLSLGAHDVFIGEVVAVQVDDREGAMSTDALNPLAYCPNDRTYRRIGESVGTYGFSARPSSASS